MVQEKIKKRIQELEIIRKNAENQIADNEKIFALAHTSILELSKILEVEDDTQSDGISTDRYQDTEKQSTCLPVGESQPKSEPESSEQIVGTENGKKRGHSNQKRSS